MYSPLSLPVGVRRQRDDGFRNSSFYLELSSGTVLGLHIFADVQDAVSKLALRARPLRFGNIEGRDDLNVHSS